MPLVCLKNKEGETQNTHCSTPFHSLAPLHPPYLTLTLTYLLRDGGLEPPTPSATAAPAAPNAALFAEALLPWTGRTITWLRGLQ